MPRPLVSILIPAYNAERLIAETVESALGQTYPNVEVLVVDDGSTDRTLEVLAPFEARGVRVIAQENAGACEARNRALRESHGDFLQFLDADDLLGPDKIERQVELLEASPPGCVAVSGTVYFEDGTDPHAGRLSAGGSHVNSDDPVQWLADLWTPGKGWGMVQTNAWLVPRAVADQAGPWDPKVTQDQDGEYFARVLLASSGVRWEPSGRNYYRKFGGDTVSGGRSERHLRGRLRAVDSKARHVLPQTTERNRAQTSAGLARQYLDIAYHAYPNHIDIVQEAEAKADALGGTEHSFFQSTRLRHIEQLAGWKAARRMSLSFHALKDRLHSTAS